MFKMFCEIKIKGNFKFSQFNDDILKLSHLIYNKNIYNVVN